MIDRTIDWCTSHRSAVLVVTVVVSLWGWWALQRIPLDAVPDLSDAQVIVLAEWPGHSPDLVENQITYPIVTGLVPTPGVRAVRGFTDFGVSYIYVVFNDGADIDSARRHVLEQVQRLRAVLPEGVEPTVGPDATGVGWVFQYALVDETGQHTLDELRSLQDWKLRYALASVPGVAEVASIGGFVKQYQVNLDPTRLAAYNLSPREVVEAVQASNSDAEGRLLEFAGREYVVRARGYLHSIEDIEQIALGADGKGSPVRVADVAKVQLGPDMRRGVAELDGRGEAVGGIIVMRSRENALRVVEDIKARLAEIRQTLPDGVLIVPIYDRSILIRDAIATLRRILVEEAVVVSLIVGIFLLHVRSALITVATLPVAILVSFVPLFYVGASLNIMSLGGLALAIGVLVDAAIVMVENAYRHAAEETRANSTAIASQAARELGRPVFLSLSIIVVSFVPVFLLQNQEGRMFHPLALTKTFAVGASTLLALTLVPALTTTVLTGRREWPERTRRMSPMAPFVSVYEPALRFALAQRGWFLAVSAALVPVTGLLFFAMGREFMPPLYEGTMLYMPSASPGISVAEMTRLLQHQDRALKAFPEVSRVFGTAGRATTVTDNSPLAMVNTTVTLKSKDEWRPGLTLDRLVNEMNEQLQLPGVSNVWTQPIRGRLDMLSTGIKTPVGIKILGSDLSVIQDIGGRIEEILGRLPGTKTVYAERSVDGYFTDIRIDRAAIARVGLTVRDVEDVVETAIGGRNIGYIFEGRERYPINVRYGRDFRDDLPALERVLIKTPKGAQISLRDVADIEITKGPSMIRDEDGHLAGYVYIQASSRDIGNYVARAQAALAEHLKLPPGYLLRWSGQYEMQLRSAARVRLILPIVFMTIFAVLYLTFWSLSEAGAVMVSVAYAMTGGVLLQWVLGYNFSVAVWLGYITLYGVATQTGIIMVIYLREEVDRRMKGGRLLDENDFREAVVAGALLRLRPKLMTVAATILGLLPILWSTGVGADVMKPIAAPIIGGMMTSAVHVLIITPVVFFITNRRNYIQTDARGDGSITSGRRSVFGTE
jgi:copper/silver efflux system protein